MESDEENKRECRENKLRMLRVRDKTAKKNNKMCRREE